MMHQHTAGLSGARSGFGGRMRRALALVVPAVGLAVALAGVAPAESTLAQDNSGAQINLGGNIADVVAGAVSGIATNSTASGGVQSTHSQLEFGDQEGLAISDASGGNHNISADSK
jgi:hypothetical protein